MARAVKTSAFQRRLENGSIILAGEEYAQGNFILFPSKIHSVSGEKSQVYFPRKITEGFFAQDFTRDGDMRVSIF